MKHLVIIVCLGALAACSPAETPTPIIITATDEPPKVVVITNTPKPPTSTPRPTRTPAPTLTKRPTLTPTPVPAPIVLTGTGDGVVDVEKNICPCVLWVLGNNSNRHFAVENFDANGNQIELLVNTTDPYDGYVPLDFLDDEVTTRFQVTARGEWTLTLFPLIEWTHVLKVPGVVSGKGDDVVVLVGSDPDVAVISGNKASRYFGVTAWGNRRDLLVNTTDPYDGTVIMSADAFILQIRAQGEWTIEVKAR